MSLTIAANGTSALDEAMTDMASAFDPQFGEAWTRSQCAGVLSGPGADLLIARAADPSSEANDAAVVPIGFALLRTIIGEAELMLIAVAPEARRGGVARQLLLDCMATAQARGATRFLLEVRADNPALSIYRAAGLVPVGRRADYYRGNDGSLRDALTLAKEL